MSAPLSVAPARPPGADPRRRRRERAAVRVLAGLLVVALAATWLLWDNLRLDVSRYQVAVASSPLPAGGVRIAQISDLHDADLAGLQDRLLAAVEQEQPDVIALTGDLIDDRTASLEDVLALAEGLRAVAPTYYVLGNHEADLALREPLLEGLAQRGVRVLRDAATTLAVDGQEITIVGLDDPWVARTAGAPSRSPRAILGAMDLPAERPVVLLAHRPELLESYAGEDVDLVLSGHAHGGQVRIPGVGGLYAPHQGVLPELTAGTHRRGGTTMVISRGLGNTMMGVRVNNPRELVVVDLVPA